MAVKSRSQFPRDSALDHPRIGLARSVHDSRVAAGQDKTRRLARIASRAGLGDGSVAGGIK